MDRWSEARRICQTRHQQPRQMENGFAKRLPVPRPDGGQDAGRKKREEHDQRRRPFCRIRQTERSPVRPGKKNQGGYKNRQLQTGNHPAGVRDGDIRWCHSAPGQCKQDEQRVCRQEKANASPGENEVLSHRYLRFGSFSTPPHERNACGKGPQRRGGEKRGRSKLVESYSARCKRQNQQRRLSQRDRVTLTEDSGAQF